MVSLSYQQPSGESATEAKRSAAGGDFSDSDHSKTEWHNMEEVWPAYTSASGLRGTYEASEATAAVSRGGVTRMANFAQSIEQRIEGGPTHIIGAVLLPRSDSATDSRNVQNFLPGTRSFVPSLVISTSASNTERK